MEIRDLSMDFDARERLAQALQPLVSGNRMRSYSRSLRVSSNTVAKWLACESFPSGENVLKVAQSLGMSLDEFDRQIVQGTGTVEDKPVDKVVDIVASLPPGDLPIVLDAVSDRIRETSQKAR